MADLPSTTLDLGARRPPVEAAGTSPQIALSLQPARLAIEVAAFAGSEAAVGKAVAKLKGITALPLGPGRYLVTAEDGQDRLAEIRAAIPEAQAAVIDQSHGRSVLRLAGPRTRDVLAKGCSLDFDVAAFPAGRTASSLIGHIAVLLHAVDGSDAFDVYVARSLARDLWEWFADAAAEYGLRVAR